MNFGESKWIMNHERGQCAHHYSLVYRTARTYTVEGKVMKTSKFINALHTQEVTLLTVYIWMIDGEDKKWIRIYCSICEDSLTIGWSAYHTAKALNFWINVYYSCSYGTPKWLPLKTAKSQDSHPKNLRIRIWVRQLTPVRNTKFMRDIRLCTSHLGQRTFFIFYPTACYWQVSRPAIAI